MLSRFKNFEVSLKDILVLFNYWERAAGALSNQAVLDGVELSDSPVGVKKPRKQGEDYKFCTPCEDN